VAVAYPILLLLQKALKYLRCKSGDFPITESVARERHRPPHRDTFSLERTVRDIPSPQ
jgi:hypothetical protein